MLGLRVAPGGSEAHDVGQAGEIGNDQLAPNEEGPQNDEGRDTDVFNSVHKQVAVGRVSIRGGAVFELHQPGPDCPRRLTREQLRP